MKGGNLSYNWTMAVMQPRQRSFLLVLVLLVCKLFLRPLSHFFDPLLSILYFKIFRFLHDCHCLTWLKFKSHLKESAFFNSPSFALLPASIHCSRDISSWIVDWFEWLCWCGCWKIYWAGIKWWTGIFLACNFKIKLESVQITNSLVVEPHPLECPRHR